MYIIVQISVQSKGKRCANKKKIILYVVQFVIIKASEITETYNSMYCILRNNL